MGRGRKEVKFLQLKKAYLDCLHLTLLERTFVSRKQYQAPSVHVVSVWEQHSQLPAENPFSLLPRLWSCGNPPKGSVFCLTSLSLFSSVSPLQAWVCAGMESRPICDCHACALHWSPCERRRASAGTCCWECKAHRCHGWNMKKLLGEFVMFLGSVPGSLAIMSVGRCASEQLCVHMLFR